MKKSNLTVVGGAGHIGLPLALLFTKNKMTVNIFDKNKNSIKKIQNNTMPFYENNGQELLDSALRNNLLNFSYKINNLFINGPVIICIGTPVDEYGNPELKLIFDCLNEIKNKIKNKLIIFRSTLAPGSSKLIYNYLIKNKITKKISFCPERVLQGKSIEEIKNIPQIISAYDNESKNYSKKIFSKITNKFIVSKPEEAELAKLFTNSYRYIKFAIANQFFNISEDSNLNFHNIYKIMKKDYPRMADFPSPGFAAGPCLYKDTLQLASHYKNNFSLGHSSLNINEGFIFTIIEKIKKYKNYSNLNVGLLGMSFKPNIDDTRVSLSYKLKKHLKFVVQNVYTHDPHVTSDKELKNLSFVIKKSNILIICIPHDYYKNIDFKNKKIIDIWGI